MISYINSHGLLFLAGMIILIFVLIFIIRDRVIPFKMMNRMMKKFLQSRDINELKKYSFDKWPAMEEFLHYQMQEQEFGSLAELKRQHAEYLALQNQINPHFLFNTLEDIRGDALEAGMIGIARTTGALATYFRYTITEPENLVRIEDELDNVENYYTIQQYRFGDRLKMEIDYPDGHLGYPNVKLPKLTLQPIVENAISHGLEGKVSDGLLRIQIETSQKDLIIHVSDNGAGIDPETVRKMNQSFLINKDLSSEKDEEDPGEHGERHNGIALNNINNRISLLFGDNYGLHIYSKLNIGTDVQIRLPLVEGESE